MSSSFEKFAMMLFELRERKVKLFSSCTSGPFDKLQHSETYGDGVGTCYVRASYFGGLKTIHLDSINCADAGNGWFTGFLQDVRNNCEQVIIENVINPRLSLFLERNGFTPLGNLAWGVRRDL